MVQNCYICACIVMINELSFKAEPTSSVAQYVMQAKTLGEIIEEITKSKGATTVYDRKSFNNE